MRNDDRAYDKIAEAAASFMRDEMSWLVEDARGDSPIERILCVAINMYGRFGCSEFRGALWAESEEMAQALMRDDLNRACLVIESQKQLPDWRVDFMVHAYSWWPSGTWRSVVIECDGHDYHEKTKEQARRDRSRDRRVQRMGKHQIYRFTGSEIWNDAWGCAREVYDWAAEGL